jgi:hypothetical protein
LNNNITNKMIKLGVCTFNKTVIEAENRGRRKNEKLRKAHKVREEDTNLNCPQISVGDSGYRILGKTTFHLESHTVSTGKSNCTDLRFSSLCK